MYIIFYELFPVQLLTRVIFNLVTDLVSKDIVEKWIRYLRNEFPTVAFKASTQQQTKNLVFPVIMSLFRND